MKCSGLKCPFGFRFFLFKLLSLGSFFFIWIFRVCRLVSQDTEILLLEDEFYYTQPHEATHFRYLLCILKKKSNKTTLILNIFQNMFYTFDKNKGFSFIWKFRHMPQIHFWFIIIIQFDLPYNHFCGIN